MGGRAQGKQAGSDGNQSTASAAGGPHGFHGDEAGGRALVRPADVACAGLEWGVGVELGVGGGGGGSREEEARGGGVVPRPCWDVAGLGLDAGAGPPLQEVPQVPGPGLLQATCLLPTCWPSPTGAILAWASLRTPCLQREAPPPLSVGQTNRPASGPPAQAPAPQVCLVHFLHSPPAPQPGLPVGGAGGGVPRGLPENPRSAECL